MGEKMVWKSNDRDFLTEKCRRHVNLHSNLPRYLHGQLPQRREFNTLIN
jgi:hypothetical protein